MNWWKNRQNKDIFVKKRNELGVISRSFFKIEEINNKYKLIKKNDFILDLGAAPGGWCEYFLKYSENIYAIDLLPLKIDFQKDHFIQGDICDDFSFANVNKFNFITSDIAPNFSGNKTIDTYAMENIIERVFVIIENHLITTGHFVMKIFTYNYEFMNKLFKKIFKKIYSFKPESSRKESAEIYYVGINKI